MEGDMRDDIKRILFLAQGGLEEQAEIYDAAFYLRISVNTKTRDARIELNSHKFPATKSLVLRGESYLIPDILRLGFRQAPSVHSTIGDRQVSLGFYIGNEDSEAALKQIEKYFMEHGAKLE